MNSILSSTPDSMIPICVNLHGMAPFAWQVMRGAAYAATDRSVTAALSRTAIDPLGRGCQIF